MSVNESQLKKIIKKFEEIGSFEVKSGRERKLIALMSVEGIVTALQEKTSSDVD